MTRSCVWLARPLQSSRWKIEVTGRFNRSVNTHRPRSPIKIGVTATSIDSSCFFSSNGGVRGRLVVLDISSDFDCCCCCQGNMLFVCSIDAMEENMSVAPWILRDAGGCHLRALGFGSLVACFLPFVSWDCRPARDELHFTRRKTRETREANNSSRGTRYIAKHA